MGSDGKGKSPPQSNELRDARQSLTSIERFLGGRLIDRQLVYTRNVEGEIRKYGPDGTIKLYSARALGIYSIVIAVIGISLAAAGESVVAVPVFALLWLLTLAGLARCISGARSARQWRQVSQNR